MVYLHKFKTFVAVASFKKNVGEFLLGTQLKSIFNKLI